MNTSNKKIIVIAIVLLLMLLVFFGLKNKKSGNVPENQTGSNQAVATPPTQDTVSSVKGNIFDLLKGGSSVQCTYTYSDDKMKVESTVYVDGKKMRSDALTTLPDSKQMTSHMISDGEWFYSWTSSMPQGFKMKIDDATKKYGSDTTTSAPTDKTSATPDSSTWKEFQNKVDYKCNKWSVDNSKFDLPTDVQFTDYSTMMNGPTGGNSGACAACSYIQDASAKAQCLSRLNCK